MKPPRRRMTTRKLIVATALFALDFAGIAWVLRPQTQGALGGMDVFVGLLVTFGFFFGAILLLLVLIYLYVPPRLDEVLMVLLILTILVGLIVPSLQHS
jgi:hypothetical protein